MCRLICTFLHLEQIPYLGITPLRQCKLAHFFYSGYSSLSIILKKSHISFIENGFIFIITFTNNGIIRYSLDFFLRSINKTRLNYLSKNALKSHSRISVSAINKSTLGLFNPISTLLYVPVDISTPLNCNCATVSLLRNPFSTRNFFMLFPKQKIISYLN